MPPRIAALAPMFKTKFSRASVRSVAPVAIAKAAATESAEAGAAEAGARAACSALVWSCWRAGVGTDPLPVGEVAVEPTAAVQVESRG
eukprot:scaffold32653_cov129-Isochrysis_galbana.AAC.1